MAAASDDPWADTTALVLCGGLGTRLRDVVGDRPKGIADVGGRPFLDRLLDQVAAAGLARAILCTGYMAGSVRAACGDRHLGMALTYSEEEAPRGTGGAIRLALPLVSTRNLLVLNGDSYCHVDLAAFRAAYEAGGGRPTILLVGVPDASRFGRVECDADGVVQRFVEKSADTRPGLINAGVYLLPVGFARTIPADRAVSLEREMFPTWISSGLLGFRCVGPFIDIGTPESYAAAQKFFASDSDAGELHAGT